ncbi:hypothetical protein HK405_001818, partial [Cladochytrium tenue]
DVGQPTLAPARSARTHPRLTGKRPRALRPQPALLDCMADVAAAARLEATILSPTTASSGACSAAMSPRAGCARPSHRRSPHRTLTLILWTTMPTNHHTRRRLHLPRRSSIRSQLPSAMARRPPPPGVACAAPDAGALTTRTRTRAKTALGRCGCAFD